HPSTMTRLPLTRAALSAYCHAAASSSLQRTTDCPLPDEEIVGFTTQGKPIPLLRASPTIAAVNSCSDAAKRYVDVGNLSVSASTRRMPLRVIVSFVARAVGMTSA